MQDGICYIQYNANTIYAFPNLHCNEGDLLPSYTSTARWTYYVYNGRYVLSNKQTHENNYNQAYGTYVSHIYHGSLGSAFDPNYLVLPATILVVAFFSIIYRWFIRLRG